MVLREYVTDRSGFYSLHHSHDRHLREFTNFQPILTFGIGRLTVLVCHGLIRLSGCPVNENWHARVAKAIL